MTTADELEKLADLRDRGLLTEAEFESEKAKVLQRPPDSGVPTPLATQPSSPTALAPAVVLDRVGPNERTADANPRAPSDERSWFRRPLAITIAAVIVVAAAGGAALALTAHSGHASSAGTDTITGALNVEPAGWNGSPGIGDSCYAAPVDNVNVGDPVLVANQSGATIGTGSLDAATVGAPAGGNNDVCAYSFTVSDLPAANFYAITVGSHGTQTYSLSQLKDAGWSVPLLLNGDGLANDTTEEAITTTTTESAAAAAPPTTASPAVDVSQQVWSWWKSVAVPTIQQLNLDASAIQRALGSAQQSGSNSGLQAACTQGYNDANTASQNLGGNTPDSSAGGGEGLGGYWFDYTEDIYQASQWCTEGIIDNNYQDNNSQDMSKVTLNLNDAASELSKVEQIVTQVTGQQATTPS
jgi:hypothetical protein